MPQSAHDGPAPHATSDHVLDVATHRLGLGIAVGLGIIVAALLRIPLRRLWSPGAQVTPYGVLFRQTGARLAVFQVAGFLMMETAEAWLLRGEGAHFHQAPDLLLGVIAQCLAALLAAAVVVLLVRAVRSLTRSSAVPKPAEHTDLPRPNLNFLPLRIAVARGGATLRGPPLAV